MRQKTQLVIIVEVKPQKTKEEKNLGELMLKENGVIYQIKYLC